MRRDGTVTVYEIEHLDPRGEWARCDLTEFLFRELSYDQKQGAIGDYRRALLKPFGAGSVAYQHYGLSGCCDQEADATAMLIEVSSAAPGTKFRTVARTYSQSTDPLAEAHRYVVRGAAR